MSRTTDFEGISLSDQHIEVLHSAVVGRGSRRITLGNAKKIYSNKRAARNAMESLEGKGIVERRNNGDWLITNLPTELHKEWLGE